MTLPRQFQPMEPILAQRPFDDPEYLHQVKWDGVRMLAFVDGSSVRLQNRRLHLRTDTYPEITAELSTLGLRETIIDGEIVAFDDGRPSFSRVMRRDSSAGRRPDLMTRIPVVYVMFDLVHYDGEPIVSRPLTDRLTILRRAVRPSDRVLVTDDHESGIALFDVMADRGWEGIVAKRRLGPYRPGLKSPDWKKIKLRRSERFRVAGYVSRRGRLVTLLLTTESDGRYVGRAGTGLTDLVRIRAAEYLAGARQRPGPPLRLGPGETGRWIDTDLVAEVEFQEWTDDLGLRSPVIKALGLAAEQRGSGVDAADTHGRDR